MKINKWINKNWLLLIFLVLTLVAIFVPYNVFHGVGFLGFRLNTEHYNELGDFIGGITTPILSFLGIVYLYKTYKSQKKELRETQRALQAQQASSSLFSMISVLENIIASLRGNFPKTDDGGNYLSANYVGRDVITYHYKALKHYLKQTQPTLQYYYNEDTDRFDEYTIESKDVADLEDKFGSTELKFDPRHVSAGNSITVADYEKKLTPTVTVYFESKDLNHLKPYFNYIEAIIEFVLREFQEPDQDFYFRILCSQFSNDELGLIYYYSMSMMKQGLNQKLVQSRFLRTLNHITLHNRQHIQIYRSKVNNLAKKKNKK